MLLPLWTLVWWSQQGLLKLLRTSQLGGIARVIELKYTKIGHMVCYVSNIFSFNVFRNFFSKTGKEANDKSILFTFLLIHINFFPFLLGGIIKYLYLPFSRGVPDNDVDAALHLFWTVLICSLWGKFWDRFPAFALHRQVFAGPGPSRAAWIHPLIKLCGLPDFHILNMESNVTTASIIQQDPSLPDKKQ